MKFGTDIRHLSGHCRKGFQGQRSKVKVIVGPNVLFWGIGRRPTFRRCGSKLTCF